jgi:sec-independent protein translocase protein TatA
MSLDNPIHLAFLLLLVLLVFGAKRLPEMGRSLGTGMRGFRDGLTGGSDTSATTPAGELPTPPPADSATKSD